eukprot:Awhi_evm1s13031
MEIDKEPHSKEPGKKKGKPGRKSKKEKLREQKNKDKMMKDMDHSDPSMTEQAVAEHSAVTSADNVSMTQEDFHKQQ